MPHAHRSWLRPLIVAVLLGLPSPAVAAITCEAKSVELADAFAGRQLLVSENGRDVTREAKYSTSDPAVAKVDAVLCAYVGLYSYHRPEDVTVYGDYATGYIVTPTLPPGAAPARRRRSAPQTDVDDLRRQVAQVAALLDEAQRGLAAISRQLGG